jgi:hypothetical protein
VSLLLLSAELRLAAAAAVRLKSRRLVELMLQDLATAAAAAVTGLVMLSK